MKVYIVTESRTSADLYEQSDDYTKIVGAFAKRGDAMKQINKSLDRLAALFAAGFKTEVVRAAEDDGRATFSVTDHNGNFEHEFSLAVHEEEVLK